MSWVSYTKLKSLCDGLRNKMVSNEYLLANSDKSKGVHMNIGGQDGLMIMSPVTEDGSTPAALWVTDSDANNATELTGGTLSYVTDNGKSSEDFTSLSLVGGVVNVSGKSGAQRRITNVATPSADNDVANKKYVDSLLNIGKYAGFSKIESDIPSSTEWTKINKNDFTFFSEEYPLAIGHVRIKATLSAKGLVYYRIYQLIDGSPTYLIGEFSIYNPSSNQMTLDYNIPFDYYAEDFSTIAIEAKTETGTTLSYQLISAFFMNVKKDYINKAL